MASSVNAFFTFKELQTLHFFENFKTQHQEIYRFTLERTPMARWGKPMEVVPLIAFLLSDYSSYITGGLFPVDGGWAAC